MVHAVAGSADPVDAPPAPSPIAEEILPRWFEGLLIVAVAGVLSWGGAGLLLADLGKYSVVRAATLGCVGTLVGLLVAWRSLGPARPGSRHGVAIAMCVAAVAIAGWHGKNAGHHVAIGRDPGGYAVIGKWISQQGTLVVNVPEQWPASVESYSSGLYKMPDNTLEYQWSHFFPVLLAEAEGFGGDALMFRVNAALLAISLCVVFAFGCRLVRRPGIVLAAVVGLGLSIPIMYTARDTYSEIGTQLLLWAGVWLLCLAFQRRGSTSALGLALVGGGALGATVMTRIDGVAYLIVVPMLAAIGWLATKPNLRRATAGMYAAAAAGATPAIVLGTLDVQRHSGNYYHDLHGEIASLYLAVCGSAVIGVAALIVIPRVPAVVDALVMRRNRLAVVAGSLVAALLLAAWFIRPSIQHMRWSDISASGPFIRLTEVLQRSAGVAVDGTRTYGEQSVRWFSWYLGPVTTFLAIIGAAALVSRTIRRPSAAGILCLGITGVLTAVYLWNPHIATDQPWASRRFVPASFPLFALLAASATATLAATFERAGRRLLARVVVVACAAGMIGLPLQSSWPIRNASPYAGFSAAIKNMCTALGPDSAVLFLPELSQQAIVTQGRAYTATVRSWCEIPVAWAPVHVDMESLLAMSARWRAAGRQLWVVAASGNDITGVLPDVRPTRVAAASSTTEFETTLIRRPAAYRPRSVEFWAAPVR